MRIASSCVLSSVASSTGARAREEFCRLARACTPRAAAQACDHVGTLSVSVVCQSACRGAGGRGFAGGRLCPGPGRDHELAGLCADPAARPAGLRGAIGRGGGAAEGRGGTVRPGQFQGARRRLRGGRGADRRAGPPRGGAGGDLGRPGGRPPCRGDAAGDGDHRHRRQPRPLGRLGGCAVRLPLRRSTSTARSASAASRRSRAMAPRCAGSGAITTTRCTRRRRRRRRQAGSWSRTPPGPATPRCRSM